MTNKCAHNEILKTYDIKKLYFKFCATEFKDNGVRNGMWFLNPLNSYKYQKDPLHDEDT